MRKGEVVIRYSPEQIGFNGELLAARYLKKAGYKVLESRYHSAFGEIDLIVQNKSFIVFVEVKLRKNTDYGRACEAVTFSKQQKIIKTALQWLAHNDCDRQPRFDIIEIYTDTDKINHIENAFA